MTRPKFVIYTVPHAKCPIDPLAKFVVHHLCDFTAPLMAKALAQGTTVKHRLIVGDDLRSVADLNRPRFRDRPFRQQIRKLILQTRRYSQVWLFDIHSFPNGSMPYSNSEVAFLDDKEIPEFYVRDFADWLRGYGILARVYSPAHPEGGADIETEARELGVRSMLIEFNESLEAGRIREIIGLMQLWINEPWPD